MESSDYIAAFALLISLGSLYLSKKSFDHTKLSQKNAESQLIENEKTKLLQLLSNNKSLLNKARIEIGALKADFEIESQPIKIIMTQYTNLFTEFLPKIEDAMAYIDNHYNDIVKWRGDISYTSIMRSKAACHEALKDFEISHEQAVKCIEIFKEKLQMAKEYTNGATK